MQRDYINKGKIRVEPLVCFECDRPFAHERFYSAGYTFCAFNCKKLFERRRKLEIKTRCNENI